MHTVKNKIGYSILILVLFYFLQTDGFLDTCTKGNEHQFCNNDQNINLFKRDYSRSVRDARFTEMRRSANPKLERDTRSLQNPNENRISLDISNERISIERNSAERRVFSERRASSERRNTERNTQRDSIRRISERRIGRDIQTRNAISDSVNSERRDMRAVSNERDRRNVPIATRRLNEHRNRINENKETTRRINEQRNKVHEVKRDTNTERRFSQESARRINDQHRRINDEGSRNNRDRQISPRDISTRINDNRNRINEERDVRQNERIDDRRIRTRDNQQRRTSDERVRVAERHINERRDNRDSERSRERRVTERNRERVSERRVTEERRNVAIKDNRIVNVRREIDDSIAREFQIRNRDRSTDTVRIFRQRSDNARREVRENRENLSKTRSNQLHTESRRDTRREIISENREKSTGDRSLNERQERNRILNDRLSNSIREDVRDRENRIRETRDVTRRVREAPNRQRSFNVDRVLSTTDENNNERRKTEDRFSFNNENNRRLFERLVASRENKFSENRSRRIVDFRNKMANVLEINNGEKASYISEYFWSNLAKTILASLLLVQIISNANPKKYGLHKITNFIQTAKEKVM